MRTNRTLQKLSAGGTVVGAHLTIPSPDLVEMCGAAGLDFVTLDIEHEPISAESVVHMIRAAEAYDITPIVRLPLDPDRILVFLDAGAQGIQVPRCRSKADVEELVKHCYFHPLGERTFYRLGRGGNYELGMSDSGFAQAANEQLLVIAMIEDVEALPRLPEMLAVPGLSGVHIGSKDLWQSMGMPAPEVVDAAVAGIEQAAARAGKFASFSLRLTADADARLAGHLANGTRMINVMLMDFVRNGTIDFAAKVRGMAGAPAAGRRS